MNKIKIFSVLAFLLFVAMDVCAQGYYLVGTMTNWQINSNMKLTKNVEAETEYYITTDLSANDEFKVVYSADGKSYTSWFPDTPGNYVISVDGTYTIYFRPNYDAGEDWYEKCIYVGDAPEPDDPEPEPNPAATVTAAPTAAENVFAGTNTALVSAGSASGGTMMYKMTTTNQKPTNVNGFSTTIPTSENITGTCIVYVWYYVKGDNEHRDSWTFGPVTVSVISSADFSVSGNEYTIHTATGWDVFCNMLAGGEKFSGKTVTLDGNITVTQGAGSGAGGNLCDDDRPFCGTFDGGGYTLTFNYGENGNPADEDYIAPFRYVNNATIQHLHVDGDIYTKHAHTAGIVGLAYGTSIITDCRSSVNIYSSIDGDGTHGGIAACTWTSSTTNITGCLFEGSIQSATQGATKFSTNCCGGFVGWRNAKINITNSLLTADLSTIGTTDSYTFVRRDDANNVTLTNCYYTRALGDAQGKQALSAPASPVGSATATYEVSHITAYANGLTLAHDTDPATFYYGHGDQVAVSYIDEDGTTAPEPATATVLSGNAEGGETLAAGTYVVASDISYTGTVTLNGNVTLILADNCHMNVGTSGEGRIDGYGIDGYDSNTYTMYDLTITSEANGSGNGALSVYTKGTYNDGIFASALTINGGNITADTEGNGAHALIAGHDIVTINGGTVSANATGSDADAIYSNWKFNYSGGNVTATAPNANAICAGSGNYNFSWRTPADRITIGATGLYAPDAKTATFARLFTDGTGNYYGATLTGDELNALAGKTLSGTAELVLANAADNSARIVAADGIEGLTVTLQGRTLYKDGAWNTLCLPFDITNAQLDALDHPLHGSKIVELDVESKEEDGVTPKTRLDNDGTLYLYFNSVYDYMMPSEGLKAGKPYLVKWEKLNGYDENPSDFDISDPVFSGVTIDASASTVVAFNGGAFVGIYSPVSFAANTKSVLFLGAENKLYWPNADMTLRSCRAYFDLGTNEARKCVLNFNDDEDNTTGIAPLLSPEGDDAGASPRGGLVGASWYDLQGRRLSQKPMKAGLYIYKGKKLYVK